MKIEADDHIPLGSFRELVSDRSGFQQVFQDRLRDETALAGRVLDIGCGGALPRALRGLETHLGQLDGVDPSAAVHQHPLLTERWQAGFEDAPIPEAAYDIAYAYNVLEHIADPHAFFHKLHRVLKPGGVFWALTPHGVHRFCRLTRTVELLRLKHWATKTNCAINDYPAYYRLNSRRQIVAYAKGFSVGRFYYMPCVQWDQYFPRVLRAIPHAYDRLVGAKRKSCMLIFAFRLQK